MTAERACSRAEQTARALLAPGLGSSALGSVVSRAYGCCAAQVSQLPAWMLWCCRELPSLITSHAPVSFAPSVAPLEFLPHTVSLIKDSVTGAANSRLGYKAAKDAGLLRGAMLTGSYSCSVAHNMRKLIASSASCARACSRSGSMWGGGASGAVAAAAAAAHGPAWHWLAVRMRAVQWPCC